MHRQAKERFGDVQTPTYDLAGNGKGQIRRTSGAAKLVKAGAMCAPSRWSGRTWSARGWTS